MQVATKKKDTSALTRLNQLEAKKEELQKKRDELSRELSEEAKQSRVDAILEGKSIEETLEKVYGRIEVIDRDIDAINAAIRDIHDKANEQKAQEARRARDQKKHEAERRLKKYHQTVLAVQDAENRLRELNREIEAQGYTGFEFPLWPGLRTSPLQEQSFLEYARLKGFDIGG